MKKNVMMRVASIMLVLVLMSSSVISGTFAKYVTEGSATTSARVAKWGVTFETDTDKLFQNQYDYAVIPTGFTTQYSVKADTKVVAPGTSGTGYSFTTKHTEGNAPEVSYLVTFKMDPATETISLTEGGDTYYPVKYSLKIGDMDVCVGHNSLDVVKAALEKCQYMYDVDTNKYYTRLDKSDSWTEFGTEAPKLVLSWAWDFYVDDATDIKDTKLGNLAAGIVQPTVDAYNLEIAFTVNATAEQID